MAVWRADGGEDAGEDAGEGKGECADAGAQLRQRRMLLLRRR